jgi:phage shock protein PspC (stress-responsive transcriptional regulator)
MVRAAVARDLGAMPETPDSPGPPEPENLPPEGEAPTEQAPRADAPPADEAPTTSAPTPGPRRLLRSRDDRVITGVAAGIARYFDIDPLIVRIAFVALSFVGGAGLIAYAAAYLLVPTDDGTGRPTNETPSRLATILGAVAIVLAGVALFNSDFGFGFGFGWTLAPFGFLVLILAIVGQRLLRRRGVDDPPVARIVKAGLLLFVILIACVLLFAGSAWATASGGGTAVAAAVVALGIAMIALSFRYGEARWLALPALVLAIPAGVVSAAGVDIHGGVGQRTYTPATVADLKANGYKLGIGEIVLDLRTMQWPKNGDVSVKIRNGTGHALVVVPPNVCVQAKTHAGLGYVNVLGEDWGGADLDDQSGTVARYTGPRLIVDGKVGIGALEIRHHRAGSRYKHPGQRFDEGVPDQIAPALAKAGCAGEPE